MKIVIKSFNGIGDLLFLTPTLRVIKEAYPESFIEVNTNYPVLLEKNPYVDRIGNDSTRGVFLGYDDPIHAKLPYCHHILRDWEIVCKHYGLITEQPDLHPDIYMDRPKFDVKYIPVQVIHKGHWHKKKMWDKFEQLSKEYLFGPIPHFHGIKDLVGYIESSPLVVCAEGGISHIAKAVGTPAIVIYGGFASPVWNGYPDQINICKLLPCSYCYSPGPCESNVERECLKKIEMSTIARLARDIVEWRWR
jgi:ADP-heptose:LPS heptosyltransferase